MHAAQKPKSKLKFVAFDKESNMSTLWRREEFLRICSKEELAEKAQDIEVTIPVKKSQETRYNFDPGSFFVNRFWGRRPDGVAINGALQIVYILEFERSTDRDEGFPEVKEAEANEQHKSIICAQNQGISHGLQIGKDQDDSSQDTDYGYQFNNICFIDDISIFDETPEGMQTLLDVVQEFTTWCGMEINVKKTFLLVIDDDDDCFYYFQK